MEGQWLSKTDLLQDLEEFGVATDVGVIQDRPRTNIEIPDEDNMLCYQFYGRNSRQTKNMLEDDVVIPEPDLTNISSMVQMVKMANEAPEARVEPATETKQNPPIVISKLNPNVEDFIPVGYINRNLPSTSSINQLSTSSSLSDCAIDTEAQNTDSNVTQKKKKIIKSKKNIAIEAIMRLCSDKNNQDNNELKLLKPDDILNAKETENAPPNIEGSNDVQEPTSVPQNVEDSQKVEESINKVNHWLEEASGESPEKKLTTAKEIHVETIKFTKSPDPTKAAAVQKTSTSNKSKKFVPSADRYKKLERFNDFNTEEETVVNEDIWDRTIRILKAIDKQKALEKLMEKDEKKASKKSQVKK